MIHVVLCTHTARARTKLTHMHMNETKKWWGKKKRRWIQNVEEIKIKKVERTANKWKHMKLYTPKEKQTNTQCVCMIRCVKRSLVSRSQLASFFCLLRLTGMNVWLMVGCWNSFSASLFNTHLHSIHIIITWLRHDSTFIMNIFTFTSIVRIKLHFFPLCLFVCFCFLSIPWYLTNSCEKGRFY